MGNWNIIEKNINKEISFLSTSLFLSPYHQNDAIKCNDCLFREIAIFIVAGKVKAKKIIFKKGDIWEAHKYQKNIENEKPHGAAWHHTNMKIIEDYFKRNDYKIEVEPNLHYGRADLAVPAFNLFIEVGTINLYKLYFNLISMNNVKIVIMPSDDYLIEFCL